jgi:hypothetical protein
MSDVMQGWKFNMVDNIPEKGSNAFSLPLRRVSV